MLKLGLLGTVIGFIFMLGSLVDLNSIDINVMQKLLTQMSGGMKVALFTTLTGMSCGVLLNIIKSYCTDRLTIRCGDSNRANVLWVSRGLADQVTSPKSNSSPSSAISSHSNQA